MVRLFGQMKRKKTFPVVIIGAGPAGLTAAYELSAHNCKSLVVEKDSKYVGGLAKTMRFKGFRFDIGGHRFFSKNREIENLWTEILGKEMLVKKRLSRIFYKKKFFDYPLKPLNALKNLGVWVSITVCLSYIWVRFFPIKNERSFEDWVTNRFGKKLYTIFFKNYTEKVWGIPAKEISADWAAQRIRGLSLKEVLINAFFGQKKEKEIIKTLTTRFRYPKLGPGMFWEKVKKIIETKSSQVLLGSEVISVNHDLKKVASLSVESNNRRVKFYGDHFISSMPLADLITCFNPEPPNQVLNAAKALKYRDFLIVVLIISKKQLFSDQWIYIHDPEVHVGRIQNFKNWSRFMVLKSEMTCLGLEYFCSSKDDLWNKTDDKIIEIAVKELEFLGLIDKTEVLSGKVIRVPKAYPVYDKEYLSRVNVIKNYLQNFKNLQVVGRNGMHKYNNQDHAMMTGLLAARNILGGTFNLWRINTDAEYAEEERITKTTGERLVPERLD
ncbi:MAG: UDP-galactopyranose mutase [Candidatus Curtissbacteria bacterium GW2011_GWC2_38_9]|uniref:UDP-galactopyranose mutase n=3 Tax=Candidatus Curtissiibacteriota TaxID=1752717 RepID=A0A0G0LB81_9BACT|nr:MAG: UDP-galactopyranose mutase [Candidatus Curtissbacteria bacterium GW2011_GWC2_38_9]